MKHSYQVLVINTGRHYSNIWTRPENIEKAYKEYAIACDTCGINCIVELIDEATAEILQDTLEED